MSKKEYEVGFGRPPVETRFGKGRSGNPKGRPRGAKNLKTILAKEQNAPVVINENGRRRTITKLQAGVKQMVNKAATGDPKALQQLLGLQHLLDGTGANVTPVSEESDQQVINSLLKRMQRNNPGEQS